MEENKPSVDASLEERFDDKYGGDIWLCRANCAHAEGILDDCQTAIFLNYSHFIS